MTEVGVEVLNELDLEQIINYEPGYDWIPNRFGPPPGIGKSKKQKLGKKYLLQFYKTKFNLKLNVYIFCIKNIFRSNER